MAGDLGDKFGVVGEESRFGKARSQRAPVGLHGKGLFKERQRFIHATHIDQRDRVPIDHLGDPTGGDAFRAIHYLDAEENVALPLLLDGHSFSAARERTERVLTLVDLIHRRHHKPTELSGGEMQRMAIARALITSPRVILADEPTGNLDSTATHAIMRLLRRGSEEIGVTVLMVTHDPVCASYGDRVVRLVDGRIVEDIDVSERQAPQDDEAVGSVLTLPREP